MSFNSIPPFSLRIFVADGDPDGLRLVDRSNWIGTAVIFPRAIYTQVRGRDEFQQTGVDPLFGHSQHERPDVLAPLVDCSEFRAFK